MNFEEKEEGVLSPGGRLHSEIELLNKRGRERQLSIENVIRYTHFIIISVYDLSYIYIVNRYPIVLAPVLWLLALPIFAPHPPQYSRDNIEQL